MVENSVVNQRVEYAEICKIHKKKKATEEIRKYNQEIMRETIVTSKSLKKVRRTQKLGQDRLIKLRDKQGREIHDQDQIIERIEEFYNEQYDCEQRAIMYTYQNDVPKKTNIM